MARTRDSGHGSRASRRLGLRPSRDRSSSEQVRTVRSCPRSPQSTLRSDGPTCGHAIVYNLGGSAWKGPGATSPSLALAAAVVDAALGRGSGARSVSYALFDYPVARKWLCLLLVEAPEDLLKNSIM